VNPNLVGVRLFPFGVRLQQTRVELGLTQERFAAAVIEAAEAQGDDLTLTASAVSRWEAGTFVPALRYRCFISQVLGVDIRVLFPPEPRDLP